MYFGGLTGIVFFLLLLYRNATAKQYPHHIGDVKRERKGKINLNIFLKPTVKSFDAN